MSTSAAAAIPRPDLNEVIKPALDAYVAQLAEHGHDYSTWRYVDGERTPAACVCGYTGKNGGRRAVGLHVAAAHKRASKACDVETERLWDEAQAAHRAAAHAAGGYQW